MLPLSLVLLPLVCPVQDPPPAPSARLDELVRRDWEFRLSEDPLLATAVGRTEGLDRLPEATPEARERTRVHTETLLAELRQVDAEELDDTRRATHEILERLLADRLADLRFGAWMVPINSDSGFHTSIARLPEEVPLSDLREVRAYVARLRDVPRYLSEETANLRAGIASGTTLPRAILDGYEDMAGAHAVLDLERSVFWAPFRDLPAAIRPESREPLLDEAREAVALAVGAYGDLRDFLRDEYIPGARTSVGARDLPDGRAWYEHLVRHFTTLELTPEEVHAIGLSEVARIRAEMEAIVAAEAFEGTFADFLHHLRTDERYYARTPEELLERASRICKRMDAALPSLFTHLPRQPYGVEPVPDAIAPRYTGGRYVPAPIDGTRAGTYWVNTYDLPSRPLYILEALSLHEAVPGHHLQHALAAELEDLPEFRRHLYHSAFGEGWALYCERLGKEVGFYRDPISDFGRLTYEMWRACRLVVDTGLHALGWSRQQAVDYLAGNTALSLHEVGTEIDRYIAWPGQALSYKIGELEIWALRHEAEQALGPDFDLRRFHDALLAQGSVPLPTLRRLVRERLGLER